MRNLKKIGKVFFIICFLLLLSTPVLEASTPLPRNWILTLRIDKENRIFWNNWYEVDSLPRLILSDTAIGNKETNTFPVAELSKILDSKINDPKIRLIIIIPHPEIHYVTLKNVLTIIDDSIRENFFPDVQYNNINTDSLKAEFADKIICYIKLWYLRDDNIINAVYGETNIARGSESSPPEEHMVSSRWGMEFPDIRLINIEWESEHKGRKVGIPRPIINNDTPIEE